MQPVITDTWVESFLIEQTNNSRDTVCMMNPAANLRFCRVGVKSDVNTDPSVSRLKVHAVDEVIGLLCGEGAGLLQLVADKAEAAANHKQEQGGDEDAKSQGEDGTCWEEATGQYKTCGECDRGALSYGNRVRKIKHLGGL